MHMDNSSQRDVPASAIAEGSLTSTVLMATVLSAALATSATLAVNFNSLFKIMF